MTEYYGFKIGDRVKEEYGKILGTVTNVSPKIFVITVKYDDGKVKRYNLFGYETGQRHSFDGTKIINV